MHRQPLCPPCCHSFAALHFSGPSKLSLSDMDTFTPASIARAVEDHLLDASSRRRLDPYGMLLPIHPPPPSITR